MKKNNKKGFTLVELVIVVAVMAVLVAVAIPTVSSITGKAKTSVRESNARTIESMLKLEEAELTKDTDGTVTLNASQVTTALTKAKLGITSDTFYYLPTAGTVKTVSHGTGSGELTIAFDADGTITVS